MRYPERSTNFARRQSEKALDARSRQAERASAGFFARTTLRARLEMRPQAVGNFQVLKCTRIFNQLAVAKLCGMALQGTDLVPRRLRRRSPEALGPREQASQGGEAFGRLFQGQVSQKPVLRLASV
jgi:hypothetical protein